jgi:hypothetical protein
MDVETVDPLVVDATSMQAAVRLAEWFLAEARRIYALLIAAAADEVDKRTLILVSRKGGRLTARQFCQFDRRFRNDSAAARAELDRQAKSGQGHWELSDSGRTSEFVRGQPPENGEVNTDADAQVFDEKKRPPESQE